MFSIFKKELRVYFTSLLGYTVMGIFLLIAGVMFSGFFLGVRNTSDFSGFFTDLNTVFLFIVPVLTLRILAEDKKIGTYELLLTSPVSSWEIIMGKFLSVFLFVLIGVTLLLFYPLVLAFYTTVEWGTVFSGYFGILCSLAFFISIGMFASALTDNYVVAGLLSFGLFLFLFIIAYFGEGTDNTVTRILKEVSYSTHYNQFAVGLIKAKDILYFAAGTFLWLYLAKFTVESKTWK